MLLMEWLGVVVMVIAVVKCCSKKSKGEEKGGKAFYLTANIKKGGGGTGSHTDGKVKLKSCEKFDTATYSESEAKSAKNGQTIPDQSYETHQEPDRGTVMQQADKQALIIHRIRDQQRSLK